MKKMLPAILFAILVFASVAQGATYEWVDDRGGVHFTDDPDRIPAKYLKRVKKRDDVKGEETRPEPKQEAQPAPPPTAPGEMSRKLYGGRDQEWWRARFNSLRSEIKSIQDGGADKREKLNTLRRKRAIYQRASDRTAYNEASAELERDEARIKDLQEKLNALEGEAAKAGVPLEWR